MRSAVADSVGILTFLQIYYTIIVYFFKKANDASWFFMRGR